MNFMAIGKKSSCCGGIWPQVKGLETFGNPKLQLVVQVAIYIKYNPIKILERISYLPKRAANV